MSKPSVPDELDQRLDAEVLRMKRTFREGNCEEALGIADQIWQQLPEPQSQWDYYSQIVPLRAAQGAIEGGALDRAAVWLERAYEGYEPLNEADRPMLDFVKAKLFYRAGHPDLAFAYFEAIYASEGRRPFKGESEDYWQFFEERRKAGPAQASEQDVVPPVGSGPDPAGQPLPDELHARITALYEEGNNYEDLGASPDAVRCYTKAAALLPQPRDAWEAGTLVYTALGDSLLAMSRFDEAERALRIAQQCPGGTTNGYVWLRLGDALSGLGRQPEALEAWTSAYSLEGKELFEDEDDAWAALVRAGIPT